MFNRIKPCGFIVKSVKQIFHKQFGKRVSRTQCQCGFCQSIIKKQFEKKCMLEDCGMIDE